ncbi:MAG: MFS transporter, partial [Alphaproteobacteria bacterium]
MNTFSKRTRSIIVMTPALSAAFILAHFLRSAPALIAPDLRMDLGLTPGELSSLPAAIFFGAALMQLPVGVLLDRFGPRLSMFSFMNVAAIGTLVFAFADNIFNLRLGLFLIGCGAAPVFMGVIVLLSRWVARDRLSTATAISVAVGGVGMLLSSSPFAS